MSLDISLLKQNHNYRNIYFGQLVSHFGTLMSTTVIPLQVFNLTHSSAMVGFISLVELVPLLLAAFVGGVLADHFERKKLLMVCESLMALGIGILFLNSLRGAPSLWVIFVVSALLQITNGVHRPAMDSLIQAVILPKDVPAAAALSSFKGGFITLFGPSLGGILISTAGAPFAYGLNLLTFVFSVAALSCLKIKHLTRAKERLQLGASLLEGLRYAVSRQELIGTYVVDMVAMLFAFPVALFPALSQTFQHKESAGLFYSALAIGSLVVPLFSSRAGLVQKPGKMVIIAAALWGVAIVLFGLASNFWVALGFLIFAGMADTISGIFRSIIWNKTIPNEIRGRMAGIEVISYTSGPLLGNARAGWMASLTSTNISLVWGGVLCVVFVLFTALLLPGLNKYSQE